MFANYKMWSVDCMIPNPKTLEMIMYPQCNYLHCTNMREIEWNLPLAVEITLTAASSTAVGNIIAGS